MKPKYVWVDQVKFMVMMMRLVLKILMEGVEYI